MESTDLARARASTAARRPVEVTRAVPLTGVRPVRRAIVATAPNASTLDRFNDWRRAHYVADQVMRVAGLFVGALFALALVIALVVWAARYIAGQLSPVLGALGGMAGVIALALVVTLIVKAFGRGDGHKAGYGFHYGKCK